jgi:hypothetical protein
MECWSDGVLECWSVGVLECWSVGVLECWSTEPSPKCTCVAGLGCTLKGRESAVLALGMSRASQDGPLAI